MKKIAELRNKVQETSTEMMMKNRIAEIRIDFRLLYNILYHVLKTKFLSFGITEGQKGKNLRDIKHSKLEISMLFHDYKISKILCFLALMGWVCTQVLGAGEDKRLAARAASASERTKMYSNALNSILHKTVIFSSGLDYYTKTVSKNDAVLQRMNRDVVAARDRVNQGRVKQLPPAEQQKLQIAYHQAKTRQLKHLLGSIESGLYNSNEYILDQWMIGCLVTSGKIVEDYLANLSQILEPLLFGDVAGVLKNLVLQMLDSTYKVTFVGHAKAKYGATEKIAQYWWKTYFVDPVNKSNDQKFVEGTIGQGLNEVKDQLGKKIGERVKLTMLSKGEKMSEEAIKQTVESHAKTVIKNLIDSPALLVEVALKYYLVIDAHLLFKETAPNEILMIKKIRDLVGDNEKEINRCYFEPEYFLTKYEQKHKKPPKVEDSKPVVAKPNKTKKVNTVSMMEEAVLESDRWQEVVGLVKTDRQIDQALNALDVGQDEPPKPNDVLTKIDDLWRNLQKDEMRLTAFLGRRSRIEQDYSKLLDQWQEKAEKRLQKIKNLSRDELKVRLDKLDKKKVNAWKSVQTKHDALDSEIKLARKKFAEDLSQVYGMFNSVKAMRHFDNEGYFLHYRALISKIKGWSGAGSVDSQEPQRTSLETTNWLLNGVRKDYEKQLDSGKPSVYVLKFGPALIGSLDDLQKIEWNLIDKDYHNGLKQYKAWEKLFDLSPRWMYEDIPELGSRDTQQHVAGWIASQNDRRHKAFRRIVKLRLESGSALERIADLNRRTMVTLRKTRAYFSNALEAGRARVKLFSSLVNAFEKRSKTRQTEYMNLRKKTAIQMHGALKSLFAGDLELAQVRDIIQRLDTNQKEWESLSSEWAESLRTLSQLSELIKKLSRNGVESLENNRKELAETRDKGLVMNNNNLKDKAERALKAYKKSPIIKLPWDLDKKYQAYAKENFVKGYSGLAAYAPASALHIKPSDKDFVAVSYGDVAAALRICARYERFRKKAESVDEARTAAEKAQTQGLAQIRKKLDEIGDRPVTQEQKDAFMAEINALDKKVVKIYNSFGNNWKHWNSNEETELVLRIERLTLAKPGVEGVQKSANDWLRTRLAKYEKDLEGRTFGTDKEFQKFSANYWKLQADAGKIFKKQSAGIKNPPSFQFDKDILNRITRIQKLHLNKRPK